MNYWASVFIPWEAPFDKTYWGAIDAHMADSIVMENNFVAGAQRSGILYKGGLCPGASIGVGMNHSIKNNIVHSSLAGVSLYPDFSYSQLNCVSINDFTIFKSVHWAIYYQNPSSVIIDSNVLVDNRVSVAALVIGDGQLSHLITGDTIQIKNSILIGTSSTFDCLTDVKPNDFNSFHATTIQAYGGGPTEAGNVGIITGTFLGATNMMPIKPWYNYYLVVFL